MSLALYRKYRPKTFDDISGQSAVVQTLRNQVISNNISHAYLFNGLKGSGKTSIARILARAINCSNPVNGNPCCSCECCNYKNNVNPDIVEIDAASNNGVENIRQLIDEVNYKPTNSKFKVYIIDEVHMLTSSSFNALLKTLEEPPSHAVFILATTELYKVPDTIKSRCQLYTFKYINENDMLKRLNDILSHEGVDYFSEEAIKYIIAKSEGSLRDAINILEQCINRYNKDGSIIDTNYIKDLFGDVQDEIILELVDCMEQKNIVKAIDIFKEQFYNGCNLVSLYQSLHDYFFNKLTNCFGTPEGIILERYCRITGEAVTELERSNQRIIVAEVAFIKLCKPEMEKDYNSVVQRLSELQNKIEMLESGNIIVDKSVNNVNNNNDVDKNVILYYNSNCDNINLTII